MDAAQDNNGFADNFSGFVHGVAESISGLLHENDPSKVNCALDWLDHNHDVNKF